MQRIDASDTPQAEFVSRILPTYTYAYARRYGRNVCPMYDALAAAVLVDPTYAADHRIGPVNVVDDGYVARAWLMEREDHGPLALDIDPTPPTKTIMAVDGIRFINDLVEAITTPLPAIRP
jgi:inosine-uridine nucleoside N-ribohydrolase